MVAAANGFSIRPAEVQTGSTMDFRLGLVPVLAAASAFAGAADPSGPAQRSAPTVAPRIFLHDPAVLVRRKERWRANPRAEPAVANLLTEADRALDEKPFSIVDKDVLPQSGDKHDYLSLAPYAWPDPRKPNGLPYVMRDGKISPERDTIPDHRKLARICSLGEILGLAYFFSGDEKYAAHATALLRTFFIAAATRMNPNLNFAQGVRGKESGRAAGIVDAAGIVHLVDGASFLVPSDSWTKADAGALHAWLAAYLTWLQKSDLGRKEGRANNNHGTWYDVQVVSLDLATGQTELATETLSFARKRRIGRQIEPDGQQPEELRRTRPWHYASFNLQAMVLLANLGARAGVDLWHYQTPDGRCIPKAVAWLLPFAAGKSPWVLPDLDGMKAAELWPIVREAALALPNPDLAKAAAQIDVAPDPRLALYLD